MMPFVLLCVKVRVSEDEGEGCGDWVSKLPSIKTFVSSVLLFVDTAADDCDDEDVCRNSLLPVRVVLCTAFFRNFPLCLSEDYLNTSDSTRDVPCH